MYSTFLTSSPGSVLFSRSNLLKRKDLCFSCLRLGLIRHRRSLRSSHLLLKYWHDSLCHPWDSSENRSVLFPSALATIAEGGSRRGNQLKTLSSNERQDQDLGQRAPTFGEALPRQAHRHSHPQTEGSRQGAWAGSRRYVAKHFTTAGSDLS
jgi:hypothetical protein